MGRRLRYPKLVISTGVSLFDDGKSRAALWREMEQLLDHLRARGKHITFSQYQNHHGQVRWQGELTWERRLTVYLVKPRRRSSRDQRF